MKAIEQSLYVTLYKIVATFSETLELQYWTFSILNPTVKVELLEFYTFSLIKLSCIVNIWYKIITEKLKRFLLLHLSNWCDIDSVRIAILYFLQYVSPWKLLYTAKGLMLEDFQLYFSIDQLHLKIKIGYTFYKGFKMFFPYS